jgi:mRNA-degrading endonuclease RelE of RelBE toxin-antitoxin system
MYEIEYTLDAVEDLKALRKFEQQLIVHQIRDQLSNEPTRETRNRKQLRPNNVSVFELRITKFRVFYDVYDDRKLVKICAIGHKEGSRLIVRGKEYPL